MFFELAMNHYTPILVLKGQDGAGILVALFCALKREADGLDRFEAHVQLSEGAR
jgi:hypothetical protein